MKQFRDAYGRKRDKTLRVGELRKLLEQYPANLPVLITWEGVSVTVLPDKISRQAENFYKQDFEALVLDANDY